MQRDGDGAGGAPATRDRVQARKDNGEDALPNDGVDGRSGRKAPDAPATVRSFPKRHPLLMALAAGVLIAAAVGGYMWWSVARQYESTDDAYIQARFFTVSPKVSGYVQDVPVTDNQVLDAGAVLAVIDPRDYKTALTQAQAQVAQAEASIPNVDAQIAAQQAQISEAEAQIANAKAALEFAQQQNTRAQDLVKTGAGTVQTAQQTSSQLRQAEAASAQANAALTAAQKQLAALKAQRISSNANIEQAKAQAEQARINLSYTTVRADQAGRVTQLTAAKGQLVQAGQSLMVIVPNPQWVVANFRETQIHDMKSGQPVDIRIDAYPGRVFKGHIDSVQSGSGTAFSLLPAENATGNFVKVVQRVPVKIDFDQPPDVILGPGMSVVPKVKVR